MSKIHRRMLLKAGTVVAATAGLPGIARAQAKIAPPTIIKAGTL